LVILFLLLLISFYLLFIGRPGILKSSGDDFAIKDTARIRLIEIRSPDQIIILEKLEGRWMINRRYTASNQRIKGLLELVSRLSIDALVPGSIYNEILEKLENEGKRLMILTNRRNPYIAFMYHDTVHTDATYMMKDHSGKVFKVEIPGFRTRNLANLFVDDINYWRDHTLIQLMPDEIRSVSYVDRTRMQNSFNLIIHAPGDYQLYDLDSNEVADPDIESIEQYLGYFTQINFERFLSPYDHNATLISSFTESESILTICDSREDTTQIRAFRKFIINDQGIMEPDLNRLFGVINNTDTVIIKYVDLDPIMKEIGYFLQHEKK
ncbi:MAG: hypothetical protein AMS27_07240, partial [Bacteroides sp. SM23_62_1]